MRWKKGLAMVLALSLMNPAQAVMVGATEPVDNSGASQSIDEASGAGSSSAASEDDKGSAASSGGSSLTNTNNDKSSASDSASSDKSVEKEDASDNASSGQSVENEDASDNASSGQSVENEDASNSASSGSSIEIQKSETLGLSLSDLFGEDKKESLDYDAVYYNTGNYEYTIVPEEAKDLEPEADYFEEDGSFTIEIGEDNPFFPYEVQFRVGDDTWTEWFATPDSTVDVAGHTIGVSVNNGRYSSLTLHVGDRDVVVYPEEKTFSNGMLLMMNRSMSLQPLKEQNLSTVDLTGFTPVELTKVSSTTIFAGQEVSGGSIVWNRVYSDDDQYTISEYGDDLNLSYDTCSSSYSTWEFIVGEADQLAGTNVRYRIPISVTASRNWLVPSVVKISSDGTRNSMDIAESEYYDYDKDNKRFYTHYMENDYNSDDKFAITFGLGSEFTAPAQLSVYEGNYTDAAEAVSSGKDITSQVLNAGYSIERYSDQIVTFVSKNSSGDITGCLPVTLNLYSRSSNASGSDAEVYSYGLYNESGNNVRCSNSWSRNGNATKATIGLYKGYKVDGTYKLRLRFEVRNESGYWTYKDEAVVSAFEGNYDSEDAAKAAGATDIKSELITGDGYTVSNLSGKVFTVFADPDGNGVQKYTYTATLNETNKSNLSAATSVTFNGLVDSDGNSIKCYVVDAQMDSYGDYNYRTIIVDGAVDLTNVAPTFYTYDGVKLYASGSTTALESGKDYRDFSNGKVQQYTAASENGEMQENIWLQIVQNNAEKTGYKLYINSLGDEEANYTVDEDGVIHADREVIIDGRHDYEHEILVINMGSSEIKNVGASLESDTLTVDEYWTLSGNHDLSAYSGTEKTTDYGELANLAKIRLTTKKEVKDGTDLKGTLTLTSEGKTIAVINLTGTVGNPTIVTETIPDAVKYVHFATMIQNNNKYKWNKVSYTVIGSLPDGLSLNPNGEIYGVPTTPGDYTFSIRMDNSAEFDSVTKEFTIKVLDNTDKNVDESTSENYEVTQKIPDFTSNPTKAYTFVSKGIYSEFTVKSSVILDGQLLTPGKDYDSESGSTRITIFAQTLAKGNGTHTISVEFRDASDKFNRAAQNYHITGADGSGDSGKSSDGNGGNGSNSGSSSQNSSSSQSSSSSSNSSASASTSKAAATLKSATGNTTTVKGETTMLNAKIVNAVQGPQAQAVFAAATPAGYRQISTFNVVVNGGINYDNKNGRLVLSISKEYQKSGRTFALIGIGTNGQPFVFTDVDTSDETITADININGYAFALICTDDTSAAQLAKQNATTGNVYVVQPRDTLSKIARNLGTTVDYLVKKNNIANPNKIYPNQQILY